MGKLIINADDFGISKGVNEAVVKMHKEGNLTSASLMVNLQHTLDAVKKAKELKTLSVGLHFNLTAGRSILHPISIPLLVNDKGVFKNSFIKLLILSIFKRKAFLSQVEGELKAQLEIMRTFNIYPSHIDSHRHIHYILGIFNLVHKVAEQNKISRVRVINESIIHTLKLGIFPPISGIIKWFVLKILSMFNGSKKLKSNYFFSIIHSCRMSNEISKKFKLPKNFKGVEFMIHPSITKLDKPNILKYEKCHLTSHFREVELKFKTPNNL